MVDARRFLGYVGKGGDVVLHFAGRTRRELLDAAGEVAVGHVALMLVDDTATVAGGLYEANHAQPFEHRTPPDLIEQTLAAALAVVTDGVAAPVEMAIQGNLPLPVVQVDVAP